LSELGRHIRLFGTQEALSTPCLKNVPRLACYDFDTSHVNRFWYFWQICDR